MKESGRVKNSFRSNNYLFDWIDSVLLARQILLHMSLIASEMKRLIDL